MYLRPVWILTLIVALFVGALIAFQTFKIRKYDRAYLMINSGDTKELATSLMQGEGLYTSAVENTGVWAPVLEGHSDPAVRSTSTYKVIGAPNVVVWEINYDLDGFVVNKIRK